MNATATTRSTSTLARAAGAGGVFLADTTQEAKRQFGPVYEALTAGRNVPGNNSPFRDIDHAVAEGPALVGSPQQVIDKILGYHELYGHDLQSISLPTTLPFEQQLELLERFALEVIPAVRAAAPTTLWGDGRPLRRPPGSLRRRRHEPDAAATIATDHVNHRSNHVYAHDTPLKQPPSLRRRLAAMARRPRGQRSDPHGFLAVTHLHWLTPTPPALAGAPGTWRVEDDVVRVARGQATACAATAWN